MGRPGLPAPGRALHARPGRGAGAGQGLRSAPNMPYGMAACGGACRAGCRRTRLCHMAYRPAPEGGAAGGCV